MHSIKDDFKQTTRQKRATKHFQAETDNSSIRSVAYKRGNVTPKALKSPKSWRPVWAEADVMAQNQIDARHSIVSFIERDYSTFYVIGIVMVALCNRADHYIFAL